MAKQTFTTGQVLTAAQMTSLQQTAMGGGSTTAKTASYVLVAADAGTVVQMNSASATTITVNTALFAAGDTVEIQNVGAGVCTVLAGTATVNTSSTLSLKQYDAGSLYFNTTSASIFFASDAADGGSPLTTKGDLYGFSTLDARIPIGTNNQVLTADSAQALGLKWATPAGGGKVLQVVSGTSATLVALSSTTYTDTNVTATITPTSATSKIMVLIMFSFAITAVVDGNSHGGFIKLFRDSTAILTNTRALLLSSPSGGVLIQQLTPVNYYDSPATTSATTYKLQMACDASSTTIYSQIANMPSGILLLEIGA